MSALFLIAATSYLLGSIPFGYLLVRLFRGEDVRRSGSGNIGATNVSRKSPRLGILTLALDALKGTVAVALAQRLSPPAVESRLYLAMAIAASFAVVGHIFPLWLKFRGGKGVATGMGSFIVMAPKAVLAAAGVFVLVVAIFRYVSLGSILAVGSFPLFAIYTMPAFEHESLPLALTIATCVLIIAKHHENLRRLIAGKEHRLGTRHA